MLSRALSLATVMLLIGCFAAVPAQAQNLEAGKSPSQIFAGTCTACHKSPRGLLKTVPAGSLPGFLRQHYTTSSEMASLLSAFLISNGATDTRYVGSQPKQEKDAKSEAKPAASPSNSTGTVTGCTRLCLRKRLPSPIRSRNGLRSRMAKSYRRKPSPRVAAAMPSGWRGRWRRPTPQDLLRRVRLQFRPRASAGPMAANRAPSRG